MTGQSRAGAAHASLRVWDAHACATVHAATLDVLADTGVEMRHERARALCAAAGAPVDGTRVRFPARLIDQAIAGVPRTWQLKPRGDATQPLRLAIADTHYGTGPDSLYVADPRTGERRRARLADVTAFAALAERLPGIDFVMSMGLPEDVPNEVVDLAQFAAMVKGTRKPIVVSSPFGGDSMRVMREMAALAGEAESFACLTMSSPPLMLDDVACDKVLVCAELGIPLVLAPAPSAGSTGPASVAALVVVSNAEVLAGLALNQLARPGAPFVYGAGVGVINMRTAVEAYVAPGVLLGDQAACDLAHWYGLPSWSYAGCSDSKLLDEQWALEAGLADGPGRALARHAAARRGLPRVGHAKLVRDGRAGQRDHRLGQGLHGRRRSRRRVARRGGDQTSRPGWQPSRPAHDASQLPRLPPAGAARPVHPRPLARRRRHDARAARACQDGRAARGRTSLYTRPGHGRPYRRARGDPVRARQQFHIPRAQFQALQTNPLPGITTNAGDIWQFTELAFNCYNNPSSKGNPVLLDPKFRQAMSRAVDKQKVVDIAFGGLATVGSSLIVPWSPYHWDPPASETYTYDPTKAKQLLDAAGYKDVNGDGYRETKQGKPLKLRLYVTSDDPENGLTSKYVAGWFRAVGIRTTLSSMDPGTLINAQYNYVNNGKTYAPDWDMFIWYWTYDVDPQFQMSIYTPQQIEGWNDACWTDPEYTRLNAL